MKAFEQNFPAILRASERCRHCLGASKHCRHFVFFGGEGEGWGEQALQAFLGV